VFAVLFLWETSTGAAPKTDSTSRFEKDREAKLVSCGQFEPPLAVSKIFLTENPGTRILIHGHVSCGQEQIRQRDETALLNRSRETIRSVPHFVKAAKANNKSRWIEATRHNRRAARETDAKKSSTMQRSLTTPEGHSVACGISIRHRMRSRSERARRIHGRRPEAALSNDRGLLTVAISMPKRENASSKTAFRFCRGL